MSQNTKELKLAVLIDADNVPYSNVKGMMEEIAKFGTPTTKRIYADWTKPNANGWKAQIGLQEGIQKTYIWYLEKDQ